MRARERAERLATFDSRPSTLQTRPTESRSAPTSRNNSSSSEESDDESLFEREMEQAIRESVEDTHNG